MKKLLTSIVILLICGLTFTQIHGNFGYNNYDNSLKSFGFKGGLNFSNISSNSDINNKIGFIAGFFYKHNFSKLFSVQSELLYSMKGCKFAPQEIVDEDGNSLGEFITSWNLNYIEIPILVKLNIDTERIIKYYFYLGPCIGYNVSSTFKMSNSSGSGSGNKKGDIDGINTFELSLLPGVIFEFDDKFAIDLRYSSGITNIFEGDSFGEKEKNSVFSLLLSMKIN